MRGSVYTDVINNFTNLSQNVEQGYEETKSPHKVLDQDRQFSCSFELDSTWNILELGHLQHSFRLDVGHACYFSSDLACVAHQHASNHANYPHRVDSVQADKCDWTEYKSSSSNCSLWNVHKQPPQVLLEDLLHSRVVREAGSCNRLEQWIRTDLNHWWDLVRAIANTKLSWKAEFVPNANVP